MVVGGGARGSSAAWRPVLTPPWLARGSIALVPAGHASAADLGLSWIGPEHTAKAAITHGQGQAVNPYAYFGECSIWPRGEAGC